jgi:hypothetical protein
VFTSASATGTMAMCVYDASSPTLHCLFRRTSPTQGEWKRWNNSALSAALFSLDEHSAAAFAVLDRLLYAFSLDEAGKYGTIYRYDGTSVELVLRLADNYVGRGAALTWNGAIWLGMGLGGELWKFDGATYEVVASGLTASGDELRGLAVWQGALWLSTRNGTELRLKRFSPSTSSGQASAWSEPSGGGSLDNAASAAQALAVYGGDLYAATQKSGASTIYKLAVGTYPTSAKTLETSLFSAGLGSDSKVFRSLTVNHAALVSGQSVRLDYRLEGSGAWTTLGTSASVGATSASFVFGDGVVGALFALRLVLTATAATTPVVYEVLVRYLVQPATKRLWELTALFEGSAELPLVTLDGQPDPQTGPQIASAIWTAQAGNGPLSYVDLDGTSYSVWLLELREEIAQRSQQRGISTQGRLTLLEA